MFKTAVREREMKTQQRYVKTSKSAAKKKTEKDVRNCACKKLIQISSILLSIYVIKRLGVVAGWWS